MNFADLIQKRYSVRAYRPDPVPDELLAQVLEAGRLAPTAAHRQAFRILVLETAVRERDLRRVYDRDWFTQAPLVLAVVALPREAWDGLQQRAGRTSIPAQSARTQPPRLGQARILT